MSPPVVGSCRRHLFVPGVNRAEDEILKSGGRVDFHLFKHTQTDLSTIFVFRTTPKLWGCLWGSRCGKLTTGLLTNLKSARSTWPLCRDPEWGPQHWPWSEDNYAVIKWLIQDFLWLCSHIGVSGDAYVQPVSELEYQTDIPSNKSYLSPFLELELWATLQFISVVTI